MNEKLEILKKQINKFRLKKLWLNLIEKFSGIVNINLILFSVFIVVEIFLRSNTEIRKSEFFILICVCVVFCLKDIFPLLFRYFKFKDTAKTAREIGELNQDIKDQLQNLIELDSITSPEEKEFVNAAISKFYKKFGDSDFLKLLSTKKAIKKITFSFLFLFTLTALQIIPSINLASKSILFFDSKIYPDKNIIWKITPGSKIVVKEKNIKISTKISGLDTEVIKIFHKNILQSEWKWKELFADSTGNFSYTIRKIEYDTEYYFSSKKHKSLIYLLSVINYPKINSLKLKITPPAYSLQSPVFQIDNGNVTTLKGSKIKFKISSTQKLSEAKLIFENNSVLLKVKNNKAEGEYLVTGNQDYFFEITDMLGNKNATPIKYTIYVIEDQHPEIKIIKPSKDIKLGAENSVQFQLKLKDDFGFSKLYFNYQLSKSIYEKPEKNFKKIRLIISKNELEQTKYFFWNMDSLNLVSGDEISYFFSVSDNDLFLGPKVSKTETFKIIIPSIDEILSESDSVYSEAFTKLDDVLEEAEKLKKEFTQLQNELKKKKRELDFAEKEKLKETLDRYEKLIDKTKQTSKNFDNLKEKLSKNNLLSEKTLNKYEELQNLFKEIGSEELKKAFQDMNELLDKMNRKNTQNKFEQIKFNEEQFQKSIERTINLLKRLQVEQKIENIKNRLTKIIEVQKKIKDNSENAESQKLFKKQGEISKQIKQIENEANDLKQLMDQLKNFPSQEMQKFLNQMKEQKNEQISEQIKNEIGKGKKNKVQQLQQKLVENIFELKNSMSQIQGMIEKKNQKEVLFGLVRIFNGLIELTENQEKVYLKLKSSKSLSSDLSSVAQSGNFVLNQLSNVFSQTNKLGQKSFIVTPELGKSLGDAKRGISVMINNLSERRKSIAERNCEEVIISLNRSSLIIKKLIDMMLSDNGNSSSQGGMSMMQQLKKMSSQQMQLNEMTQKMFQGKKISSKQMNQMQRMAQQQELIRKSLEQLNRKNNETGKSKTLSQNLDKILDKMKEAVKKMETGNFDNELKKKQEKILSKLLDAQKSILDRDFEEKRKASKGKEFRRLSPAEINNIENISDELKEELIKSLKEGYSKDYEDLIRRYFEKLRKNKSEK